MKRLVSPSPIPLPCMASSILSTDVQSEGSLPILGGQIASVLDSTDKHNRIVMLHRISTLGSMALHIKYQDLPVWLLHTAWASSSYSDNLILANLLMHTSWRLTDSSIIWCSIRRLKFPPIILWIVTRRSLETKVLVYSWKKLLDTANHFLYISKRREVHTRQTINGI